MNNLHLQVWLDDIRPAPEGWVLVKNFAEAKDIIDRLGGTIDVISLDHDLADIHYGCKDENDYQQSYEKTGYDVLLYVVQRKMDGFAIPKEFRVHSANPVGRDRMVGLINRYLI